MQYLIKHILKKRIFPLALIISVISCSKDGDNSPEMDFKQEMRDFVIGISEYAETCKPGFLIIPQNGVELVTGNGEENGSPDTDYLSAIDGHGQEDLFYGYENEDQATPSVENTYLRTFLDIAKNAGKRILVTDYCSDHGKMDNSYNQNHDAGYVSFAATHRALSNIPDYPGQVYGENNSLVTALSDIRNFLYLINAENYDSKADFIQAVTSTNYDLLIMDFFFDDIIEFTTGEISQLKNKANGGKRLLISYLSIGEAEDYRYYWKSSWYSDKPSWIDAENPDWEGNYKVKYWESAWQDIIFGNDDSYMKKILDAGFDGVYLDIIDAFEYYE